MDSHCGNIYIDEPFYVFRCTFELNVDAIAAMAVSTSGTNCPVIDRPASIVELAEECGSQFEEDDQSLRGTAICLAP